MRNNMMKDFLFLRYKTSQCWEWSPMYDYVASKGHSCDFIDEVTVKTFTPSCNYKCVVLNLHDEWMSPFIDKILSQITNDYYLVYMDDSDYNEATGGRKWSQKEPNLIFQKDTTATTPNPYRCKRYPIHFPMESMYDETMQDKKYDVCFLGNNTNPRRIPFINKVRELANGNLKHLKWFVSYSSGVGNITTTFKEVINQSKIGLAYPGNSEDQWRIWQLASTKTAIVAPKMKVLSVTSEYLPFNDYTIMRDDMEDMEEKILYLLDKDRYKEQANMAWIEYNKNHTPEKVFLYFYKNLMTEMKNHYGNL